VLAALCLAVIAVPPTPPAPQQPDPRAAAALHAPYSLDDPVPGIDRGLARARAARLSHVGYDLRLHLAHDAAAVTGTATITFTLAAAAPTAHAVAAAQPPLAAESPDLVLDWQGEPLRDVTVNGTPVQLRAVHDHVVLPAALLRVGANTVTAAFTSKVAPTGTPLTVYKDPADGASYYYTLVVPADAHRLYPCFDQPDVRATFAWTLDLPGAWTAIANTQPTVAWLDGAAGANAGLRLDARSEANANANAPTPTTTPPRRRWTFPPSKPLPTYLAAFACGPFASFEAPQPDAPGITTPLPMRVLLRASQLPRVDREALTRLHRDGLQWLARQFDVPYPWDKLDLALLPGFPYGGMEHAGAIFYREQALVFDHAPTPAELVRRSTLVYHELCHQWFGNLVTMRWFDDLWLKEGFATFVGYQAMAALEPAQQPWLRFGQRVKPRAYEIDATPGTVPVFQSLQNLADAKSAYGPIVYNKAPAVLRALHEQLGEANFRAGLKRYLEAHAYGAAEWRDLAAALAGAAGADLDRWSARWLLAPSMPQVRAAWTAGADGRVIRAEVTQRAIGGDGTWPLELEVQALAADGSASTYRVRSDAPTAAIDGLVGQPAPAALLCNPRDVAYGQFVPDATSRAWLVDHAHTLADAQQRATAFTACFEAVREAELDPAAFAAMALRGLAAERDADTHSWLLELLAPALHRWLDDARGAPLRAQAVELLLRQLRDEGGAGRELATFRYLARHARDPRVLDLCRAVVRGEPLPVGLAPGKQDAYLAAAALLAAGVADDAFERLAKRFAGDDVGKEVFLARAAAPDAASKAAYWQQYLQLDAPPEQWTQDSLSWFHWPGQGARTLPYLQQALERVEWVKQNRRIFFMPAWLDGFVNAHASAEALAIVDAFLAGRELPTDVRQKVLQSRDGLARAVAIRRAFAAGPAKAR
jgi:aminopeptidase N